MIKVEHLTKRYGNHYAIEDLSFTVEEGKIYGLLGPNGAGKSTTMNIITGYISATSGTVTVDGHDILEEPSAARACIGYLPEIPPLYMDMTPREYLNFAGELKGMKKAARKEQIQRVMDRTGIAEMADRLIKHLSKGYKQRVGLAGALMGSPKVIILDEPTVGLDPAQVIGIRELIRDLGKTHTVILSSHILSEVQAVCDQVLIISGGHLTAQGTPEELSQRLIAGGYTADTPAAIVYKATWDDEKSFICTVGTLAETARKNNITKTALMIIGNVVGCTSYDRSKLYDPGFTTEFREATR